MKMIFDLARFKQLSAPSRKNVFALALILTATIFFTGCSKSKVPATQTTVEQNTNQATADQSPDYQQPPVANPAPVVAAAQTSAQPDLTALNHAYIGWIVQNRQRPKSFEEFVAKSGMQVPPP